MEPTCPVDHIKINENRARVTALHVLILALTYIFFTQPVIIFFLMVDFSLRAFNLGKYSMLRYMSGNFLEIFKIGNKPVDQAPKRFAAGMGFVFSLLILSFHVFQFLQIAFWLTVFLSIFAFLESFVAFCAGCHVYSLLLKIRIIRSV